jgi:hypothetical protein
MSFLFAEVSVFARPQDCAVQNGGQVDAKSVQPDRELNIVAKETGLRKLIRFWKPKKDLVI